MNRHSNIEEAVYWRGEAELYIPLLFLHGGRGKTILFGGKWGRKLDH